MKRRIFAVLLCAVLALTLCACGGKNKSKEKGDPQAADTSPTVSTEETEKDTEPDTGSQTAAEEPTEATAPSAPAGKTDPGKTETGGGASGDNQEETTPDTEPGEKGSEGELVSIELPVVKPKK